MEETNLQARRDPPGTEPPARPETADGSGEGDALAAQEEQTLVGLIPLVPLLLDDPHSVYVRHLKNALTGPDRDLYRNIALTGSYGSGKSSVLQSLDGPKVLNLSLSTLGDEPPAGQNGAPPVSKTNRIQKELVKQLLYREDPSDVPDSRYRRIGSFKWVREAGLAGFVAAGLVLLGYLTRFTDRLVNFAGSNPVGRVGMHVALVVFLALVVFSARRIFHNRFWIEKFVAGPATVTLANSGSYFDEYLDEIVYFFEATDYDVVVFEDIDRFEDPHIFETLRELNTLLNNSKQLRRKIRFVYAIKDSIFEQLGAMEQDASPAGPLQDTDTSHTVDQSPDVARAELERANRTKFFDLVIPIVPFITHRSARDHMTEVLMASDLDMDRRLVTLVARHTADMRLIKNIRNEYVVFREQLLLAEGHLPGLNPEAVFSMVVYKNIHLSDFEEIRTGTSQLDRLYGYSRDLVTENVRLIDEETLRLERRLSHLNAAAEAAKALGDRLDQYIRRVLRHSGIGTPTGFQVNKGTDTFKPEELRTTGFWESFTTQQQLLVPINSQQRKVFTYEDVVEELGADFSPERWEKHERVKTNARLAAIRKTRAILLGADMADLMDRPETLAVDGQALTFAELAARNLGSPLARELVGAGYIDRNFSLYAAQFLGVYISLQAMNFLLHNVQPNRMDVNFRFSSPKDIETVLDEAGESVLHDRSIYNIAIMDYLLSGDDPRCEQAVRKLSAPGTDEQMFLNAYLARGNQREALYRRMAKYSASIFDTIANGDSISDDLRVPLFSAAMSGSRRDLYYTVGETLAAFVEDNYEAMNVLTVTQDEPERAAAAITVLSLLEVRLSSLVPLSPEIQRAAVAGGLYDLTVGNLTTALGGQEDLSLDAIKDKVPNVYGYVLDQAERYVPLVTNQPAASPTVGSPSRFIEILQDVAESNRPAVCLVARHASPNCVVQNIAEIDSGLWPVLAQENRITPTFANLDAYVEGNGGIIDEALAVVLRAAGKVHGHEDVEEEQKAKLAVLILNSGVVLPEPELRVRLADSLALTKYLNVARITAEPGKFIGLLIGEEIINDTELSFEPAIAFDWPTREFAIGQSTAFPEYLAPRHVPSEDLGLLLTSKTVPAEVKTAVVKRLAEFGPGASRSALSEAASYARTTGITLDEAAFRVLAEGKADPATVVALLEPCLETFGYDAVKEIVVLMGRPYSSLALRVGQHVVLPRNQEHLALARFFEAHGQAASDNWDKEKPELRVYMKRN
ncbi:hypothetical protein [Pseudarthrobacter oxydans]|uniref:YobI family P-loop NTPase n=1 Tax=Pseudarthrobacter oxydans TaxID=1671 RepID=UPI002AA66CFA|nr:hypothetical protein [Pseudarthrobacter oxydans]WPU08947.1 hypothetical protein SMD14_17665 [Pseudarthrobacter oxydans]